MSQSGKGHVPEQNLHEYRKLASIARRTETLADDLLDAGYHITARESRKWSEHFWREANALRVDLPEKVSSGLG